MTDTADALEALKAYQAAVSACLMVGGVAPNDTDPNNWWMMMVAALSPDVAKALISRVERAEAALRETCAALDSVLESDGLLDAEKIALDHGLAALSALEPIHE